MILQRHIECAKLIHKIQKYLREIPPSKNSAKVSRCITALKSNLDFDYHNEIDDKTFYKLGHIYYSGPSPKERKENANNSKTA